MKDALAMLTKALFVCVVAFALIGNAQVTEASPSPYARVHAQQQFSGSFDVIQDQRVAALDANVAALDANVVALQKASEKQQSEIEELIENQSKWSGGLQALLGLIGFTSVVGLAIQIYEKMKAKKSE